MISYTRVPGEVKPTETASRMVLTRTDRVRIEIHLPQKSQLGKIKKNLLGMGCWKVAQPCI